MLTIYEYARLAQMAYRRDNQAEAVWASQLPYRLANLDMTLCMTFDRIDTQGYIARRGTDIVVVFRGTEPLRGMDIRSDADCKPVKDVAGRVHQGFALALDHVWPLITHKLYQLCSIPDSQVHFVGHSMGGALAQIATSRCLTTGGAMASQVQPGGLVTFGAPSAVSRPVAWLIESQLGGVCIRVIKADVVTMLLRCLYRSPGHALYIRRDGQIVERAGWYVATLDRLAVACDGIQRRFAALVRGNLRGTFARSAFITNHNMERYITAIRRCKFHHGLGCTSVAESATGSSAKRSRCEDAQ